jgi:hypothetical protein
VIRGDALNWKKIEGYENYSISDHGDVRNDATGKAKAKTLCSQNGYYYVDLYAGNVRTKYPVHRLVAVAFIDNPDNKPTVDHIDGNRQNNAVTNLRWASYSEQNSRFESRGVRSEPITVFHYVEKRKKRGGGHESWCGVDEVLNFDSITDTAKYFGVTIGNISMMLKHGEIGRRGKMRGYRFEYQKGSRSTHENV